MKKYFVLTIIFLVIEIQIFAQVGRVGINTTSPAAMLHVKDSSVVFSGSFTLPATPGKPPISGAGIRMMWYADKAAFRAGRVASTYWDKDSIGQHSVAFGVNTKAKGNSSTAFGELTTAIGNYSVAMGNGTTASSIFSTAMGSGTIASGSTSTAMGRTTIASGIYSTSMGEETTASGTHSTAMGEGTTASGIHSTAMGEGTIAYGDNSTSMGVSTKAIGKISNTFGNNTTAKAYASFAIGQFNDTTANNSGSWYTNDPVFIIGNGTSNNSRANAMTVLKNGNVGIGPDVSPDALLHISKGTGGGIYNSSSALIIEDNASSYIQFSNPDNSACGLLSGNSQDDIRSGILFLSDSSITFRTGGNFTRVSIEKNGNVGIGTTTPDYKLELSANSAAKPTSSSWIVASDARLKTNIHNYEDGLNQIQRIHPVWFTYTGEADLPKETGVGVLAQELKEVAPYMVGTWNHIEEDGKMTQYLSVDNGAMVYMLINAVKEQQKTMESLEKRIEELEKEARR